MSSFVLVMAVVVGCQKYKMKVNSWQGFSREFEWAVRITFKIIKKIFFKGVIVAEASLQIK